MHLNSCVHTFKGHVSNIVLLSHCVSGRRKRGKVCTWGSNFFVVNERVNLARDTKKETFFFVVV